jgi:uncharacterized protein
MFDRFELTLMVTHACNLRCTYCYTGAKMHRTMAAVVARRAIERAIASLDAAGTLDLAFFGGEPLLEAEHILEWMAYARRQARCTNHHVQFRLTTNGTIDAAAAWRVLLADDVKVSISHDGLAEIHDRQRHGAGGAPSAATVDATIGRLLELGKEVSVITVVRPDTVSSLPDGLAHLRDLGVRQVVPSLDLWSSWSDEAGRRLERAIVRCADLWQGWFPDFSVSWFDAKAGALLRLPRNRTQRCGFGRGQVAVSAAGNLYPCERLIGEDRPDNPLRLKADLVAGDHFRDLPTARERELAACDQCVIKTLCSTHCRCSNYIRTGDVTRPDGLLCLLDRVCFRETVRVLRAIEANGPSARENLTRNVEEVLSVSR